MEKEGKVCCRYGKEAKDLECMDYLEFIARIVTHIPYKGQVTIRYYGLCANAQFSSTATTGPFPLFSAQFDGQ